MRSKDVEQAVLIQASADTFASLIKEIIAFNLAGKISSEGRGTFTVKYVIMDISL
jgi:hypothetical protein